MDIVTYQTDSNFSCEVPSLQNIITEYLKRGRQTLVNLEVELRAAEYKCEVYDTSKDFNYLNVRNLSFKMLNLKDTKEDMF